MRHAFRAFAQPRESIRKLKSAAMNLFVDQGANNHKAIVTCLSADLDHKNIMLETSNEE